MTSIQDLPIGSLNGQTILPTRQGDDSGLCSNLNEQVSEECNVQIFEPGEETNIGAGDCFVIHNFLDNADEVFQKLDAGESSEIEYQQWFHMPDAKKEKKLPNIAPLRPLTRVKVAQTDILPDGTIPHYRFPVNNQSKFGTTPFTPQVSQIVKKVQSWIEENLQIFHNNQNDDKKLNHAVVLLYRDENDRIGLHKDKTLDLEDDMPICSISLGQSRTYVLQNDMWNPTKRQEIKLNHGDLFILGSETNKLWYHSIRQMDEKELLEVSGNVGHRVSVTLRSVATFLNPKTNTISGKGTQYQSPDWPLELKGSHRHV
mmetsp:Transcript_25356/g.30052  ORF Transcript_25356/g.30052 Transcript_25356/m.30052 type:complete len:315 (-) Transcript_25356:123-1067(-)